MSVEKREMPWMAELERYVTDVLRHSRRRLGESLAQSINLTAGRWFVWAPSEKPLPSDFSTGGLLPAPGEDAWVRAPGVTAVPTPSTRTFLADELHGFLQESPRHICLLANEITDIDDPFFPSLPARVTYEDDVYHLLRHEMSREEVFAVIKSADSIPIAYGLLSSIDAPVEFGEQLDSEQHQSLLAHAEGLYVRAFDGESYLLFSIRRDAVPLTP